MAKSKSAAQKAKEARIKKLRWRTIVNATGDNKLAAKYSRRGNDRIEAELGIKIPTKVPRLIKPERRGKQNRKVRSYIVSTPKIDRPPLVFKSKIFTDRKPPKRIKGLIEADKNPNVFLKSTKATDELFKPYFRRSDLARKDKWAEWSVNEQRLMPKDIKRMAYRINRLAGLTDQTASYGFAVLYYAWINNDPIELWRKRLVPDLDYGGELYAVVAGFSK